MAAIAQLAHARQLCLGEPALYSRIFPGVLPLIRSNADIELLRWGSGFLLEALSSPVWPLEDKMAIVPTVLPVLKEYLDTPSQDVGVVKSAIHTIASVFPLVFLATINAKDAANWQTMMDMKRSVLKLYETGEPSLKVSATKFLIQVVFTQSPGVILDPRRPEQDISSSLVPHEHAILVASKLEAEASGLLDRILGVLQESSDALLITATLNSLGGLLRSRASIANKIVNAVLSFNPFKVAAHPLTPVMRVQMRSMERTTRNLLQNVLKRIPNHPLAPRIQQYIERLAKTRLEVYDDSGSRKRPLQVEPADVADNGAKRLRLGPSSTQPVIPPLPPGVVSYAQLYTLTNELALKTFDVKSIPIDLVIRILVPLLASVSREKLVVADKAIRARYEQARAQARQAAAEEDDDYEPDFPGSETAEQVKNRVEMDTSEEYAVQMPLGPFKLPPPQRLSRFAIDRLNDRAWAHFYERVNGSQPTTLTKTTPAVASAERLTQMIFVERLGLRSISGLGSRPNKAPSKMTTKFRQQMLQYVLQDWRRRIDLAISWLTEEWETDREAAYMVEQERKMNGVPPSKNRTESAPNYKRWLGKLLDELAAFIGSDTSEVKILIRFLSEVPEIDQTVVDKVKRLALDPERIGLTVQALHYVIMFRPAVREIALDALEDMWRTIDGAKVFAAKPLTKWRPKMIQEAKAKAEEQAGLDVKAVN